MLKLLGGGVPFLGKCLYTNNSTGLLSGGKSFLKSKPAKKTNFVARSVLSIRQLFEFKNSALRQGLWFRALDRLERGVVDLTIRYVDCVKSKKLAKVLTAILEKLQLAAESVFDKMVKSVGFAQAQKISGVALSWGNVGALAWAKDGGFARYLAVIHMNGSGFFR